jgi:hypothetical protein
MIEELVSEVGSYNIFNNMPTFDINMSEVGTAVKFYVLLL